MNTIHTASSQYASRPADERFDSLDSIITNAKQDKALSREREYSLRDLRAEPNCTSVLLRSPRGTARLTHWSFGQLARTIGAPAGYLRDLPPQLAADCVNYGISQAPTGQAVSLLARMPDADAAQPALDGMPTPEALPTVRAITTPTYKRLWDADVLSMLQDLIARQGSAWELPPTWECHADGTPKRAGAYRGDRDSFVILTNGGSIVEDPTRARSQVDRGDSGGTAMYRGIMISNSEVGRRSLTIDSVLFRYICGNHILWGAAFDRRFRRRHVGNITRATAQEISRFAWSFTQQSAERDRAIIQAMATHEVAVTRDAVIDALTDFGATQEQATAAYNTAEEYEANPRSYWGIAQGLTRISQGSGYQDDRYELDQLAAKVLSRAAKLVAA